MSVDKRKLVHIFYIAYADVAELADALDLGSSGRPCRFDSCHPQPVNQVDMAWFFIE